MTLAALASWLKQMAAGLIAILMGLLCWLNKLIISEGNKMAKPVKTYSGYDSYGRCVCIAMRSDGVWFSRSTEKTAYGTKWTKWAVDSAPKHPKKIKYGVECAGAPEYYEIPECEQEKYAEWGFSILNLCGNEGMRLPNKDFKYQLAA